MRGVAVRDDDQRVRLCQAVQCLGDAGVRAPGGDLLVHRPRVLLAVLETEPARGAFHGMGDDLVERLVLARALVDPVHLAGLQEVIGDLGRQPVAQDLTDRVVDTEPDQRSVHVERNELVVDIESHESSSVLKPKRPRSGSSADHTCTMVDCQQPGKTATPLWPVPWLADSPGLPSPCEEYE